MLHSRKELQSVLHMCYQALAHMNVTLYSRYTLCACVVKHNDGISSQMDQMACRLQEVDMHDAVAVVQLFAAPIQQGLEHPEGLRQPVYVSFVKEVGACQPDL